MSGAADTHREARRVVGGYELQRRLGTGAMGEVWLGWHVVTEGVAAVKLLRERPSTRGRSRRLFDRERRAIARLTHPNVVRWYDQGPDYIAMAYVDGADLAQRLKSPVEPAFALHVAAQVASALQHAHDRGVIHRDVKPSNVLLDGRGNAYLADFGLAVLSEDADMEARRLRAGTPGYMAPEVVRGEEVTPAADQFSLARTVVEMLCGGTDAIEAADALALLPESLPEGLVATLRRALDDEPASRWPSIADFAERVGATDVSGLGAPSRLAPEVRVRAPFAWCTRPDAVERLSADIVRARYRLSTLEGAGLVPKGDVARFREASGHLDFGWSVYGFATRVGSVAESAAFARASDLIVLIHGTLCTREAWTDTAITLCRDHAQAIVLVPDVLGFGESPLDPARVDGRHVSPQGLLTTVTDWLTLLSVRDLPTVLVGHSAAAVALLSATDGELGERTSRVAVTPIFPFNDRGLRLRLRIASWLLFLVGLLPWLRRVFAEAALLRGPDTAAYSEAERRAMVDNFMAVHPRVVAHVAAEQARARPAPGDRLQRCTIVVGEGDPLAPPERVTRALEELGFPKRSVRRMAAGGHMPHAEHAERPEWKLRNADDLSRIVESMLVSSREGAPMSTAVESTVIASTDLPSSGVAPSPSSATWPSAGSARGPDDVR